MYRDKTALNKLHFTRYVDVILCNTLNFYFLSFVFLKLHSQRTILRMDIKGLRHSQYEQKILKLTYPFQLLCKHDLLLKKTPFFSHSQLCAPSAKSKALKRNNTGVFVYAITKIIITLNHIVYIYQEATDLQDKHLKYTLFFPTACKQRLKKSHLSGSLQMSCRRILTEVSNTGCFYPTKTS